VTDNKESGDGLEKKEVAATGVGEPPKPAPAAPPEAAATVPSLPPAQAAQALQGLIQLGFNFPPAQQNPEVIHHITGFLTQDSNNRLTAVIDKGKRTHTFRLTALYVGAGLVTLLFVIPLLVELFRGDMAFVREFIEKYVPVATMIVLALFAGSKVGDLFKD